VGAVDDIGDVRTRRDHLAAAGCGGCEHAVIAHEIHPRRWNEGGELLDELEWREHDVRGSVAPAVLQSIQQSPVWQGRQSLERERRPGDVTT
jgi:hypothetical protein